MNDKQKKQMQEMLAMQNKLQSYLHPDWTKQPWDQASAILVEAAELMTELGYKWWKHHEPNYDNVRIELIDIWHFVLNVYISQDKVEQALNELNKALDYVESNDINYSNTQACLIIKGWVGNGLSTNNWSLLEFFELCSNYGMTFDDVYTVYMMKNTLNAFRWEHGYRDGTYIKIWNGVEDNLVLSSMHRENPFMSYAELYNKLKDYYVKNVISQPFNLT